MSRIYVNPQTGEVEIEGSDDFIKENITNFHSWIEDYKAIFLNNKSREEIQQNTTPLQLTKVDAQQNDSNKPGEIFGEYIQSFPKNLKNVDSILVAGYWVQRNNEDNSYSTETANKELQEYGIKLSNASTFNKQNIDKKFVFPIKGGRFRVSKDGEEHINSLMEK